MFFFVKTAHYGHPKGQNNRFPVDFNRPPPILIAWQQIAGTFKFATIIA